MRTYKEAFLERVEIVTNHIRINENNPLLKHLLENLEENIKYYKRELERSEDERYDKKE